MKETVRLYSFPYSSVKTYCFASLFIVGNIVLPQLCHLLPQGGLTWLPIYFFTLVGAYKYGWRVGLLTALFSPLINSWVFGMPHLAVLPAILLKSTLLVLFAALITWRYQRVSLGCMAAVVLGYQLLGTLGEWLMVGDFYAALQDFRIGIPGMLLQIFGGYVVVKYLIRN